MIVRLNIICSTFGIAQGIDKFVGWDASAEYEKKVCVQSMYKFSLITNNNCNITAIG